MEKLLTLYDILTGGHLENQKVRFSLHRSLKANRGFMETSNRGAGIRAVGGQIIARPASHFSLYFYLRDQACWRERGGLANNSFPVILGYLHLWSIFHTLFHKGKRGTVLARG